MKYQTPELLVQIIADNIGVSNEAKRRIDDEGIVVRDMKGSVIPHPAIKIKADADKSIFSMIIKS
jgi:phage terminase small subunit